MDLWIVKDRGVEMVSSRQPPRPNATRAKTDHREPIVAGVAEFRIENWPFYWIARVSRRYADDVDALLKGAGLDVGRWRVLMILSEFHPASIGQLADHAIVRLPTMTKLIARMERDSLVRTEERESDRRVKDVFLTDQGKDMLEVARSLADQVFRTAFDGIPPTELVKLNRLMARIYGNLAKHPSGRK